MSRVPLSVSLSGFGVRFSFGWKGSRILGGIFVFLSFISNFSFILCMKLFTSLCRFCIARFFGFGMKVKPLRTTFFLCFR